VKAHYGQIAPIGDRLFTAMNTAAPTDGLIILATKGTKTSKPIHVLHITIGTVACPHADPAARPLHAARRRGRWK
jgi:Fe-S cluster assembly scaffold protein SufB